MLATSLLCVTAFTVGFVSRSPHERESAGPGADMTGIDLPVSVVSHRPSGPVNVGAVTGEEDVKMAPLHDGAIARTPLASRLTANRSSSAATARGLYRHHSAAYWAWKVRQRGHTIRSLQAKLGRRWQPTVDYALRLASAATGVSYWQLRKVAWCESRFDPFAVNGRYRGVMQLSWSPFGFSPFDPVANVLSAALTVRREGSWRRWECGP